LAGFTKAKREQIWTKILLAGPSGSGKTYSALRLATGLAEACGSRVAAIDTENGRILYYADEFDFDDMQMDVPFTPEKYIEAVDTAVKAGYKVLIIDSSTHEWDYCLEVHSKMPGNSYTNWAKVTPRHDAFMEKILQSPIHIIATVRGKDEYIIEDKDGKKVPKKVGVGYKQRDNTEYNYTVTFNLAQDTHIAEAMKDNTHLFEGRYEMLTEKDGANIYEWANKGEAAKPRPKREDPDYTLKSIIESIAAKVTELKEVGVSKEEVAIAIKNAGAPANFNKITEVTVATAVLEGLKKLEGENKSE